LTKDFASDEARGTGEYDLHDRVGFLVRCRIDQIEVVQNEGAYERAAWVIKEWARDLNCKILFTVLKDIK